MKVINLDVSEIYRLKDLALDYYKSEHQNDFPGDLQTTVAFLKAFEAILVQHNIDARLEFASRKPYEGEGV